MEYRKRIADKLLKEQLEASGAVLIEGPKWCGKTTTAEQQAQSRIYMNDPETEEELMLLASTNIKRLLSISRKMIRKTTKIVFLIILLIELPTIDQMPISDAESLGRN